jgi:hypothetical protein
MQAIRVESLLSKQGLKNTVLHCSGPHSPKSHQSSVAEGIMMHRYSIFSRFSFGLLFGWFIFFVIGHNNVVIAQEIEDSRHVAGESKSIPQTFASLSHDANDTSVRQVEWASTSAMPVRFINDNIDIASQGKFSNGSDIGASGYRDKYILGKSRECDWSPVFNSLSAEPQPSSMHIWQVLGKERALHCLADGNIDGCFRNTTMELKPSSLRPLWIRNVNNREANCARSFVFIPFEVFGDHMGRSNEGAFKIHEEASPHNLFNGDLAIVVGPSSAGNRNDGFLHSLDGIDKAISLGVGLTERDKATKNDEADYPHTGDIVVHSPISDNCHLTESRDSVTLTCDDLATH